MQRLTGEQSNTSVGGRRARAEVAPAAPARPQPRSRDHALPHHPHELPPRPAARGLGGLRRRRASPPTLAVLQEFVDNDGDGWPHVVFARWAAPDADLTPAGRAGDPRASPDDPLMRGRAPSWARSPAGLHAALASDDRDPDFAPEPVRPRTSRRWDRASRRRSTELVERRARRPRAGARAARRHRRAATARIAIRAGLDLLADDGAHKIRVPRRLPSRPGAQDPRRLRGHRLRGRAGAAPGRAPAKQPPLRDVAGMLRSSTTRPTRRRASAGRRAGRRRSGSTGWERRPATPSSPATRARPAEARCASSRRRATRSCARARRSSSRRPATSSRYELDNRPDWVAIPLAGLSRLLTVGRRASPRPSRGPRAIHDLDACSEDRQLDL